MAGRRLGGAARSDRHNSADIHKRTELFTFLSNRFILIFLKYPLALILVYFYSMLMKSKVKNRTAI